jgi:RHS repeat-associated protein
VLLRNDAPRLMKRNGTTRQMEPTGGLPSLGYDAYGTVRFMDANFGSRSASSYGWETLHDDYRWDSETGHYQVRYRHPHPKLGTWIARDVFGYQGDPSLYSYGANLPINAADPDGNWIPFISCVTAASCGGVAALTCGIGSCYRGGDPGHRQAAANAWEAAAKCAGIIARQC